MAQYGKANREVVQKLINNLVSFDSIVQEEINNMVTKSMNLGTYWKDAQYQQFNNYILELADSLKKDLEIIEETASALQSRVDKYDM